MKTQQIEMSFDGAAGCLRFNRSQGRRVRAKWWFSQMRQVVDRAFDWHSAPAPPPEQVCLALTRGR
jgi:hypothetical protein